jgi:hypothetical protein
VRLRTSVMPPTRGSGRSPTRIRAGALDLLCRFLERELSRELGLVVSVRDSGLPDSAGPWDVNVGWLGPRQGQASGSAGFGVFSNRDVEHWLELLSRRVGPRRAILESELPPFSTQYNWRSLHFCKDDR